MYPVVLVAFVLSCGCTACLITGHPEDVVAEVGQTVTLTCTADLTICQHDVCVIHWQRETNSKFESISICESVYSEFPDRYSVSSDPDWSLTITGVQQSDVRRYRCLLYSYERQSSHNSLHATLIIPSLIVISVQLPRLPITTGDNATFHCNVHSRRGALPTLNVKWFVNETNIRRFQDQSLYHLGNNGYTLTFLKITVNQTNVHCKAIIGTKHVKKVITS